MSRLRTLGVLLCILLLVQPVVPQPAGGNSASIKIPAVAQGAGGTRGTLIDLTVTVVPGSGHVFIDTRPYAQVDVQGSARLAAMVAADITDHDLRDYDLYYVIRSDAPILEGPSAGAAMAIATIAAFNGWNLSKEVCITGTINPDGTIGPVGGLSHKLKAAADYGANTFLIPEGQGEVTETRMITNDDGPYISTSTERVTVDLYDLGEELGVVVMEVGNVRDAVYYATGHRLPESEPIEGRVKSKEYQRVVKPLADRLYNESHERYDRVSTVVGEENLTDESEILTQMQDVYNDGDYYAAMSLAFNAMIWLRYEAWQAEYNATTDKEEYVMDRIRETRGRIEQSRERVDSASVGVEALGAAQSRVARAESLLHQARVSGDDRMAIYLLAYSYERARSAEWWLEMSEAAGTTPVNESILEERANRYYTQASSLIYYAESLLAESGVRSPTLRQATEDLNNARRELRDEYYAGAAVDAMKAIVGASVAMELSGHAYEDLGERVNQSRAEAVNAILEARAAGVEPVLAVSALEHGDVLAESDSQRMYQYQFARMVAETSKALAQQPTTRPTMEQTVAPGTTPTEVEATPTGTPSIPLNMSWALVLGLVLFRVFRRSLS